MSVYRKEVGEAPIRILGLMTRRLMATRLDSRKFLLASCGVHRDWRGIAEQAGLDVSSISSGKISPTEHCLHIWGQREGQVSQLWTYLEAMDRFDVIDDTLERIYADYDKCESEGGGALKAVPPPIDELATDISSFDSNILTVDDRQNLASGLGLQHYAALVLHVDEDIEFVEEMVGKLEGEYGLKLCLKDRDLIGGLQFETESIVRLIIERCDRVIVILSPEFLASSANKFFTLFAHALSVDQRRRIVIPCLYKPCTKPAVISFCHSLDYYRAKGYWNYWEKLRDSLTYQPGSAIRSSEPRMRIREVSGSSTSSQVSVNSASVATPSPSQSQGFFSKFLRKSDGKGKTKTSTATIDNPEKSPSSPEECCQEASSGNNGFPHSSAIPIKGSSSNCVLHLDDAPTLGESSDYTSSFLPNVPDTPPGTNPNTTSSSAALLLPDLSPSPVSRSRFLERIFRGKQKKQKVPS